MNIKNIIVKDNRIRTGLHTEEYIQRVKNSIGAIGLKNPILINEKNELVNGELRLQIYKELHEEERNKLRYIKNLPDEQERGMLTKKFGEFRYNKIPYEVIRTEQELKDLKSELLESWYMREHQGYRVATALDRLSILYENDDNFLKDITKHLKVTQEEIESFLNLGRDIRIGRFDKIKVLLYKNKSITSEALYNEEQFKEEIIEEIVEFDLDDWI